jgi:hypothetical protein
MESVDPREDRALYRDCFSQSSVLWFDCEFYSPCSAFLCNNSTDSLKCAGERRWDRGLHADLDGFKGAKTNIGEEFGRGRGGQIETGLPLLGILLSHKLRVEVLEEFVAAVFRRPLDRVTKEGRTPTSEDSSNAFSPADSPPSFEVALVKL